MSISRAAWLLSAILSAGCASERAPDECKRVCQLEAQCAEVAAEQPVRGEEPTRFDQSECVAACEALMRDPRGKQLVAEHVECVDRAGGRCEAILTCE